MLFERYVHAMPDVVIVDIGRQNIIQPGRLHHRFRGPVERCG
jgi:hypothetical protein